MTTIRTKRERCPICGTKFEHAVVNSTNTFGSTDLDTRPPKMMRSTMCYWLVECPECGYVSDNMEAKAPVERSFVDSIAYKKCDGFTFASNISEGFYRHYMIMKEKKQLLESCFALLHTAWACDDQDDDNATMIRMLLADELKLLLDKEYDENLDGIRMDALRRSGQFKQFIEEYKDKVFETDILNTIRDYQMHKAETKDTDCYTVKDAVEYSENTGCAQK